MVLLSFCSLLFEDDPSSSSSYCPLCTVVNQISRFGICRFYNASTERDVRARDQDAKSKIRMYFAHIVNGV